MNSLVNLQDIQYLQDLQNLPNISIVTYRGIRCISTIPKELVWGKSYSCLECRNCSEYASYDGILVGLCENCAFTYNYKYGFGYHMLEDEINDNTTTTFGNLNTKDVIRKLQIIKLLNPNEFLNYIPKHLINTEHVYSLYDMVISLSSNDIKLLKKKNYGWIEFYKYYFDNDIYSNDVYDYDSDLHYLLKIANELKVKYKIINESGEIIRENVDKILFDKNFYNECFETELMFRTAPLQKSEKKDFKDFELDMENKKCEYCDKYDGMFTPKSCLKKCEECNYSYYCSVACQSRDWENSHKDICKKLKHKITCDNVNKKLLLEDVD